METNVLCSEIFKKKKIESAVSNFENNISSTNCSFFTNLTYVRSKASLPQTVPSRSCNSVIADRDTVDILRQ